MEHVDARTEIVAPCRVVKVWLTADHSRDAGLDDRPSAIHAWEPGKVDLATIGSDAGAGSVVYRIAFRVFSPFVLGWALMPQFNIVGDLSRKAIVADRSEPLDLGLR